MANLISREGFGHLLRGGVLRFGGAGLSLDVQFADDLTPDVILSAVADLLAENGPDVVPISRAGEGPENPEGA